MSNSASLRVLQVVGVLSSGVVESYPFLHITKTLWAAPPKARTPGGSELPTSPGTTGTPGTPGTPGAPGNTLMGRFSWPYSFTLPTSVPFAGKFAKTATPHGLPGTFVEKNGGALFVQYDLVCHVRRPPLRADARLRSVFGYTPLAAPPPPPPLRALADAEDSPLLGPAADPTGWAVLPAFALAGTLFGARAAAVQCVLAVAQPVPPSPFLASQP
jgi:hypothetical protein